MKARCYNSQLAVEALEGRSMMSAVAYADFNNDGLMDRAAITGQKTITVSLAEPDGSYTVSATLTAPKPIDSVAVEEVFTDGNPDITASGSNNNFAWKGNGDGTFVYLEPWKPRRTHIGFW
jgi:hypothetical protein